MRLPKLHLSPIFSGLLYGASPRWTGPRGGADSHGHSCVAPTNRQVGSQVRVSARNRGASATFGARTCPLASAQVAGGCLHRAPAYDCRSVGMVPNAQTGLHAGLHVVCKRRLPQGGEVRTSFQKEHRLRRLLPRSDRHSPSRRKRSPAVLARGT